MSTPKKSTIEEIARLQWQKMTTEAVIKYKELKTKTT